jgi:hypothetical protein
VNSTALTHDRAPPAAAAALPSGLTGYGAMLFIICLLLGGSGIERFRETLSSIANSQSVGMSVHPYLLVVVLVFPFIFLQRITIVPRQFVAAFGIYCSLTYVSTFYGGVAPQELIKISATILTIVTTALLVRTREDFLAGVAGVCLAVGVLAVLGLETAERVGSDIIGGTGRNTFSLYSLPMMLLGGYVITQFRNTPTLMTLMIGGAIATAMIAMVLTLNRSGWLGAGVIALLLLPGGRLRVVLVVAAVLAAVLIFFRDPIEIQQVRDRVTKTTEGNESDQLRRRLLETSAQIVMEAPLLGVSPQHLPQELALRLGTNKEGISPHNVVAQIAAGSGIPCLIAFFSIGYFLWRWQINPRASPPIAKRFRSARHLLRMMLILWIVRGMFSHEILYAPAFSMGLGLCIGMCLRYSSVDSLQSAADGRKALRPEAGRRRRRLRASPGLEM